MLPPRRRYSFLAITIERPKAALRQLLRDKRYVYVQDCCAGELTGCCFGEQLWVHASLAKRAARVYGLPPLNPAADNNVCCAVPKASPPIPETTIDDGGGNAGCCGNPDIHKCIAERAGKLSSG